ncbi:hypothetical protein TELCIR_07852 [Teladorsagia circumcincta]|uniref:Uncharacterized protein n=1 Tax=Teladorsagia circumcincta TaxID=45464 RepID=A0A2G9UJ67_TELCI|nr:hypothetical protein TELCIR_07852 [Teladorsagia circumcincta]
MLICDLQGDLELENESTVVAWFVDIYRKHLSEEPFQEELGSFLGLLEDVRYNDMLHASNYYSSVFCLVQAIAMKRFKLAMLSEVERRLVGRIHAQLKDYIQLEELREKDKSKEKETVPKIPENIRFELAVPAPEGSVVEQLQLLMFGCEQARKFIAEAMKCAK